MCLLKISARMFPVNYFCTRLGPKFSQYVTFSDKYQFIRIVADLGVFPEQQGSISAFSLYLRATTEDGPAMTVNDTFYSFFYTKYLLQQLHHKLNRTRIHRSPTENSAPDFSTI